jgi:DNA-directed RNA polymerase
MPHQNRKKAKPRWYKAKGHNVNKQTVKRKRTDARTKRINFRKKLERIGYFEDE